MAAGETTVRELSRVNKPTNSILEEFCNETTAHGLGRVLPVKNRIRTTIWSVLFIGAFVAFTYHFHVLLGRLRTNSLVTEMKVESKLSLDFPAITICNANIIKNSSLYNQNVSIKEPKNCLFWENVSYHGFDSEFWREESMLACLAELNKTFLAKLGHQFKDLVRSCTFRGMPCREDASLWTHFWHFKFGNCFVFNLGGKQKSSVLHQTKPGISQGLMLEMNIQQQEYLDTTSGAGVRVDISDQGQMPFPLESGVSLAPGFSTMIGLKKTVFERTDPANDGKHCREGDKLTEKNLYAEILNISYSTMRVYKVYGRGLICYLTPELQSCRESCVARSQLLKCGCMEFRFPTQDLKSICNLMNETQISCIFGKQHSFDGNDHECAESCVPPCRSVQFKKSTSLEVWPSEKYKETDSEFKFSEEDFDSKNNLRLHVFYQELEEEVIKEVISYTIDGFISDIGGQLGLWVGVSVLTLAEFLELITTLCRFAFKKYTKRNEVVVNPIT